MKRASFKISAKDPFRYIAAVCALGALFFTLFAIEPTWSVDYVAHSILPENNPPDGYRLLFRYNNGISVSAVTNIIAHAAFVVLCLSSFITNRPWLFTVPMVLDAAVPVINNIERGFGINYGFLIELAIIAVYMLTTVGIIRTKIPAVVVFALYAAGHIFMLVKLGFGYGDAVVQPLVWLGFMMITISLRREKNSE
ncbi:MAG: hypothetical protein IJO91_05660 [Oscillospiraceae bacterium]|nr:hypothetical protein [Oscillospiraceae bacterium]